MTNQKATEKSPEQIAIETALQMEYDESRDAGKAARKLIPGRFYYMFENGGAPEIVQFISEGKDEDGEARRTFRSHTERAKDDGKNTFDWEAYKYNNRWSLGSGATPMTVHLILTDDEIAENERAAKQKRIRTNIEVNERQIERMRREIEELETRNAELKNALTIA